MDISTIERTLLEKCAKDAGWEIDSNAPADCINLFSSFFKETGCINKTTDKSFIVRFSRVLGPSHFDSNIQFNSKGEFEFSLQESFTLSGFLKRIAELFAVAAGVKLPENAGEKFPLLGI